MNAVSIDTSTERLKDVMKSNKYTRIIVYPGIIKATIWTANPVNLREAAIAKRAKNNAGYENF